MLGDLLTVEVEMARGGTLSLEVEGQACDDSDAVDIKGIYWPHGGKVATKNIKSMSQVEQAFMDALKTRTKDPY